MDNTTAPDPQFYARFVPANSASVSSSLLGNSACARGGSFAFLIDTLERCLAGTLLLLFSPVLACAAMAVLVLSKKSPLVAHKRVGYKGRDLWVLKLRTMWQPDTERTLGFLEYLPMTPVPQSKRPPDPRVTSRVAKFCRKYSIDEIPQLWQVVKGDMALVGPRPITRLELAEYYGEFASSLVQVRPGLVGLWQVRGRSRLTYKQRRKLDEFLLRRWSLKLYMHVLLKSIRCVLAGDEAY